MKTYMVIAMTSVYCLLVGPPRSFATSEIEKHSHLKPALEIQEEADVTDEQACSSMGAMTIDYATGEPGTPKTGFRITDPRGREIAYDPKTNMGRQEIPLAQAYLDCDQNEESSELRDCQDRIEICGPATGTYRIELSSTESGRFSLSVAAASSRTRSGSGYDATSSRAELKGATDGHEPTVMLLRYSREAGTPIQLSRSDGLAGR